MHPSDYKSCAVGAIPLIGILSGLFLPSHEPISISSGGFLIIITFIYLGAIYCSALAIKHSRRLIGKLAFSLLLAFYLLPLMAMSALIVESFLFPVKSLT